MSTAGVEALSAGFKPLGYIKSDGLKFKPAGGGRIPDDGDGLLAPVSRDCVIHGQASYTVSVRVQFTGFDRTLILAMTGDPLALLAYEARRINPHWYLEGVDDV
jgi:hypothetical protein